MERLTATAQLLLARDGPRLFDLKATPDTIEGMKKMHERIIQWCEDNDVCDHCWEHGARSHCRCWDNR